MKTSLFLGAALLIAALVSTSTVRLQAQAADGTSSGPRSGETTPDKSARKAARSVPFRGKVAALDSQKMTFTLSGPKQRVFQLSSDTPIEKDGKPAAFADIAVGDEARGLYQSDADQLVVLKASFGPKPDSSSGTPKTARTGKTDESGS